MIKVNEYFDGAVKSLSLQADSGDATVGVISAGEYEFGTSTKEIMTVVSGVLLVKLPGSNEWNSFANGQSFIVEADKKFKVKADGDVSYLCLYK